MTTTIEPKDVARFLSKINKTPTHHLWTGQKNKGYGKFSVCKNGKKKFLQAHRFAYEIAKGDIPAGYYVMHDCDIPLCVNPKHLKAGTSAENARDCLVKGRWSSAKLDAARVLAIRESYAKGFEVKQLAEYSKTHPETIRRILKGQTWNLVGGPVVASLPKRFPKNENP